MKPSRNAWWLGALALAQFHVAFASPSIVPVDSTLDGVTLRLSVFTSVLPGSLSGAEAELRRVDGDSPVLVASATSDGRLEFGPVPPGRYRAVVRREGYGDAVAAALDLTAAVPTQFLSVMLLPGAAPAGRVTDPAGKPVAGASVCIASPATRPAGAALGGFATNATQFEPVCAVSGADGSVSIPRIPYGHYKVSARAAGFGAVENELTEFRAGGQPRTWVLTPAGGITGRIVEPRGLPVAGVKATFRDRVRGTVVETTSDSDGRFRSDSLAAGTWRVEIEPGEHRPLLRDSLCVKAGETVDLGVLRARPAAAIAGRLAGADGSPAAKVEIRAVRSDGPRRVLRTVTTDDQGTFRVSGLPSGARVDLLVRPGAGLTAATFKGIDAPSTDLALSLERSTRLTGVVRTEDGGVPPRAYVSVFPSATHPAFESNAGLAVSAAVDPGTGAFTAENIPSGGEVEVRVQANGYAEGSAKVRVTDSAAAPLELIVHSTESVVRGQVVDAEGLPVAGASVGRAVSDERGRFELQAADAASAKIVVTHPSFAPAVRDFTKGGPDEPVVVLDAGTVIEGTVTDAVGRPVAGVKVSADYPGATALTGVGGRFAIERVPAGSTWVRRQGLGIAGDSEARKIEVEAGESARADFRMGAVEIAGSLYQAGTPVEGSELTVQQPPDADGGKAGHTRIQTAATDEEGRFLLPGLVPGPARLTIANGGQNVVFLVEVPESGASRLALDLPSRVVEGVLLDESGKPLKGACVGSPLEAAVPPDLAPREDSTSAWSRATTTADGKFRVIVDDPVPTSLSVCTCAQGCVEVPLDAGGEGDPVTLWFDPRRRTAEADGE